MSEAPKRACEVAIRIGADNVDGIVAALRQIEFMYASEGMGHDAVMGGPDWNYICADRETPSQTHEVYFAAVEDWLAKRRAEKDAQS